MRRLCLTIMLIFLTPPVTANPTGLASKIGSLALVQEEEKSDPADGRNVRRTPTMREAVYKKLSEAQQATQAEDMLSARQLVQDLSEMRNLSSYELAQMHNFLAYIEFTEGNYSAAIASYERVLAQEDLPEALETQTLYTLGQLSFLRENYRGAIDYLNRWMAAVGDPRPDSYYLLAQAHYQLEAYREALVPVTRAIDDTRAAGDQVKEEWLLLQRVLYYELEDYAKVAEILAELIQRFPKKTYWIQLSGTYAELGQTESRLIALELVWRQGLFDREQEYLNLAQLLIQEEIPYRGAVVLQEGVDKGIVEQNVRNLRLMAQAYMMSSEDDKALPPLRQAAEQSDDGDLHLQLANIYMNREAYDIAAQAAQRALDRDVKHRGDAYMLLGMARYSGEKLNSAEEAFLEARKISGTAQSASQWIAFIRKERERQEQLAAAL